jgi:hypothetical protein
MARHAFLIGTGRVQQANLVLRNTFGLPTLALRHRLHTPMQVLQFVRHMAGAPIYHARNVHMLSDVAMDEIASGRRQPSDLVDELQALRSSWSKWQCFLIEITSVRELVLGPVAAGAEPFHAGYFAVRDLERHGPRLAPLVAAGMLDAVAPSSLEQVRLTPRRIQAAMRDIAAQLRRPVLWIVPPKPGSSEPRFESLNNVRQHLAEAVADGARALEQPFFDATTQVGLVGRERFFRDAERDVEHLGEAGAHQLAVCYRSFVLDCPSEGTGAGDAPSPAVPAAASPTVPAAAPTLAAAAATPTPAAEFARLAAGLGLFEANPNWGNGVLVPMLERANGLKFRRVPKPSASGWFAVRLAQQRGYAQLSSVYSVKRKVRYVLDPVSQPLLAGLRDGRGVLMLDGSGEGIRFVEHPFEDLHAALDRLGIDPQRILFVNSSVHWRAEYEEWATRTDRRRLIASAYHNSYFADMAVRLQASWSPDKWAARAAEHASRRDGRTEPVRHFVFTNFAPRPHRVFMLLHLAAGNLLERGYVSLPSLANKSISFPQPESGATDFPALLDRYVHLQPKLEARLPLLLDGRATGNADELLASFVPSSYFADSWFSVVSETDFSAAPTPARRFTEKTIQAMAHFHPFVVVGDAGVLKLLRGFGFRTFAPFIDERYDDILDPTERFVAAAAEIDRLVALESSNWRHLLADLDEVLSHNFALLRQARTQINLLWDLPLLRQLGRLCRPA